MIQTVNNKEQNENITKQGLILTLFEPFQFTFEFEVSYSSRVMIKILTLQTERFMDCQAAIKIKYNIVELFIFFIFTGEGGQFLWITEFFQGYGNIDLWISHCL